MYLHDKFVLIHGNLGLDKMDYGDITDRLTLKHELKCKSFEWYIGNVFPQLFNPKGRLIADSDVCNKVIIAYCMDWYAVSQ